MKIVLADLPDDAPEEKKAFVRVIAEFLSNLKGAYLVVTKNLLNAEAQAVGADVVIIFPEFPSDWAEEAVYQARRNARPVIPIHIGGGNGGYLELTMSTRDKSLELQGEEGFPRMARVIRQITKKAP